MSRLPSIGATACSKQRGQHLRSVAGAPAMRVAAPAAVAMDLPSPCERVRAPAVFIKASSAASVSFICSRVQRQPSMTGVAVRALCINPLHGQGVVRLAPGLRVEALAPDGLITAFTAAIAKSWAFYAPVTARQSALPRGLAGFR